MRHKRSRVFHRFINGFCGFVIVFAGSFFFSASADAGSISFDAKSQGSATSATSVTVSHTTGSGSNRVMFVQLYMTPHTGLTPADCTYNGDALTNLVALPYNGGGNANVYVYQLVAPDSGTHDIVCDGPDSTDYYLTAATYAGAAQSLATGSAIASYSSNSSFTTKTLTPTALTAGSWIFGGGATEDSTFTNGTNCTLLYSGAHTACDSNGPVGSGSQNQIFNANASTRFQIVAVAFAEAETPTSISFDAKSQGSATSATSVTVSHTTGSGSNRVMFVQLYMTPHTGLTPADCTYNGDALTNLVALPYNGGGNANVYVYQLVAPDSGTHDIVCDGPDSTDYYLTAATYAGAAQSLATGSAIASYSSNSSFTTKTLTPTALTAGSWIFGGGATEDSTFTNGTNCTLLYSGAHTACDSNGPVGSGSQNQIFNANASTRFQIVAVAFAEAETPTSISFDAKSQGSATSATSVTVSHTTGSGSNRVMFVQLYMTPHTGLTPADCTYNGDALTNLVALPYNGGGNANIYVYQLVAPDSGTHDIVCDGPDSTDYYLTAATYAGAAQSLATGSAIASYSSNSSFTTKTLTPTALTAGSWIFGGGATEDSTFTNGTNCTLLYSGAHTACDSNGPVGSGSQNQIFNANASTRFQIVAVAFAEAETPTSISFDAKSQGSATSATSVTVSHTTGSGSNRVMFVQLYMTPHTGLTPADCTYNGDALTNLVALPYNGGGNANVYVYQLVAPDSGTHDIVCDGPDSTDYYLTAATYAGAAQSLATGSAIASYSSNSSFTTKTLTPTALTAGSWIFGGGATEDSTFTNGTNCTLLYSGAHTACDSNGPVGSGSQNQIFNANASTRFQIVAVAFAEVGD
ncbi:MAG: hypothetical protein QY323_00505 [Patescibacteria group bacterium]|nr:MAG: hypothetical protein QY323_00505 [Patescibacteria group bacterium]